MKTKITGSRGGYTLAIDRIRVSRRDGADGRKYYWIEGRTNPLNNQWTTVMTCRFRSTADRTCRRLAEGGTFLCTINSITKLD